MYFKKCMRCGCFFSSSESICSNCASKDESDINRLKDYFENTTEISSVYDISANTGISSKNLTRFLETPDFTNYVKTYKLKF